MRSTKLKLRYFALALVAVIVSALIIQYIQFNSILKSSKETNIIEYNRDLRDRLSGVLEYNKDHINSLSQFIVNVKWSEEEAEKYFKALAADNNIIRSVYFGRPSGQLINGDDWIPPRDYNLKERGWYANALGKEKVVVSPLYEDALDGSLVVTLSKAVYDKENNLLGVVAADIKVEDITVVVEKLTNKILDYSFLIDAEGNILRHKDHECEKCLDKNYLEDLSKERYKEFRKNKSGVEIVELNKVSKYLFYDLIENTNWIVVSSISLENYENSWISLWSMFCIVLALAMMVFLTFTYAFKRYFVNPTIQFYNDIKMINPADNKVYRMQYFKNDPFRDTRELTNEIIEKAEDLLREQEKNTEEIIAQNEELEASYNQLRAMEQELRYENNKNRAVNEAIPDALFIINRKGEFIDAQASNEVELNMVEEEYVGKNIGDLFTKEILESSKGIIGKIIKNNIVEKIEFEMDGHDDIQKYEIRMAKMDEEQVLAVARNITKEKKMEAQLIDLSYRDQLTKLYNKRYFEKKINQIDISDNLPISIIMADINGLKLINDSFGHNMGDQLIKSVGGVIKKGCRAVDTVFRISGDEFIVILSNTDGQVAEEIVDRIKNISKNTKLESNELKNLDLVASFGISTKEDMDTSIYHVLKEAEDNMYNHKLYEGQKMRLKTINSMIESIYKRNPGIKEYTRHAKKYAEKLARVLNLSLNRRQTIKKTIYYQEIGKITFSDELLKKTEGFTKIELEERIKHPGIGYRILSTINEMMEVAKYVLYHHERYDGLGYPKGLKGEKIPFESRIVGLVDFYVDILRDNNFENPKSKDIIEKLRESAGKELDPKLVDIFIKEVLQVNRSLE